MTANVPRVLGLASLLAGVAFPLSMAGILPPPWWECSNGSDDDRDGRADTADPDCAGPFDNRECRDHPRPHSHTYGAGGNAGGESDSVTGGDEVNGGTVYAPKGCNHGHGVGGGFFGFGPWADEPTCNYGEPTHGASVDVNDVVFGSAIAFVIGADDMSGPVFSVDPVTGEVTCETDGSITPGDPATDPTADADDCLTDVYVGSGSTCGAGGDGGYWVFLLGAFVTEGGGGVGASNPPTVGTLTA